MAEPTYPYLSRKPRRQVSLFLSKHLRWRIWIASCATHVIAAGWLSLAAFGPSLEARLMGCLQGGGLFFAGLLGFKTLRDDHRKRNAIDVLESEVFD